MVQASLKRQIPQGKDIYYSVIIPAYNEESFLPETLAGLHLAMEAVPYPGEIIVVDNDSTDKTAEVARIPQTRLQKLPENTAPQSFLNLFARLLRHATPGPGQLMVIFLSF
jgi:hypothetical protein